MKNLARIHVEELLKMKILRAILHITFDESTF